MVRSAWRRTVVLLTLLLSACGSVPRDSNGALARARGTVLNVAVVENPPFTNIQGEEVSGSEAELIRAYAASIGARVQWRPGNMADLVESLHRAEIDVLIGGLHRNTPYAPQLALTQPYAERRDAHRKTQQLVMAVTQGESALLYDLDRFLAARAPQ